MAETVLGLTAAVTSADSPILPMVVEHIRTPDTGSDPRLAEDGRIVGHALRRDRDRLRPREAIRCP